MPTCNGRLVVRTKPMTRHPYETVCRACGAVTRFTDLPTAMKASAAVCPAEWVEQ